MVSDPGKELFEIEEVDQADNLVATYVRTPSGRTGERVDVIVPKNSNSYAKSVFNAFLPAGYPHSVTHDYLEYQIYDSLQAFSSSIAGMLSSRAVLEGIGVGDSHASPTAALLLSVLQESMGRIATILFAHRLGSSLEPECKMYRLAADVFNDAAMILDCLSPAFPKATRVVLLSFSSILRSLCGVAAGSSKASLSAHFATQDNLGELNAKDSSQETIISLMGMLAGSFVVSNISSKWATWTAMIFLLAIHLGTNYLAVRAVCMRTLNRQRANLVLSNLLDQLEPQKERLQKVKPELRRSLFTSPRNEGFHLKIPVPEDMRLHERVFERDGVLRWKGGQVLGYCRLGVSLQSIIKCFGQPNKSTGSYSTSQHHELTRLLQAFRDEEYIIWYEEPRETFLIVLKKGATTGSMVVAWMTALYFAKYKLAFEKGSLVKALEEVSRYVSSLQEILFESLTAKGWDLKTAALETKSGTRIKAR